MQFFVNDYSEGAYPTILERLAETNYEKLPGYGHDAYCERAREKIRKACECKKAEVYFLVGGTQTNATVIDGVLRSYQGVISAHSGHIAVHEAGAIEHGGHKVLTIPGKERKLDAKDLRRYLEDFEKDQGKEHIVFPGMVYISLPTEYGTLYSKKELEDLKSICLAYHLPLFIDGARLGYALASEENDVTLPDIARLADIFYIGGTKCGALFGEAIVISRPNYIPRFANVIKQNGAMLAKSRNLGIQFDTLFTDNLYVEICKTAVLQALRIQKALVEKGYKLFINSPTNQQFIIVDNAKMEELSAKVAFGYMESYGENQSVIRFCTSWATRDEDVDALIALL